MKEKIKVLITDDHPIIRRGLVMEINSVHTFEVIGEAENGEIALQKIPELCPDIIVLDIDMPVLNGIETARVINAEFPEIKIVFLSMYKENEIIYSVSKLNFMGYILKDVAILEIVDCLHKVSNGEKFISQDIQKVLNSISPDTIFNDELEKMISLLSPAEQEILAQIANLKTNREIAENLFVSIRTIENHRYNICRKLNIQGNHALLNFALENKRLIIDKIRDK